MNILIIGSTGASGRAVLSELLERGHQVTAFARTPSAITDTHERLRVVQGDVTNESDVARAVAGHDAVVVTLGIAENPILVRLRGASRTLTNVRSEGTANIVRAMEAAGVGRLVVQSTYGVGETRGMLPFKWRMIFSLLLKPQIADTERQEEIVRASNLQWSLVQPVGLTDDDQPEEIVVSTEGDMRTMAISRKTVAQHIADTLETDTYTKRSVAISAA
jgi:hypothetical protein